MTQHLADIFSHHIKFEIDTIFDFEISEIRNLLGQVNERNR